GEGPYMELWFQVEEGTIRRAAYRTYPCPAATACGSVVAEVLTGRPVAAAQRLAAGDVATLLGRLPEGKEHCPRLAAAALADAFGGVIGQRAARSVQNAAGRSQRAECSSQQSGRTGGR